MSPVSARKTPSDADKQRDSRKKAVARLQGLLDRTPLPVELQGLSEDEIATLADSMVREVRAVTRGAA